MSGRFCTCNRPTTRSRTAGKYCIECGGRLQAFERNRESSPRRNAGVFRRSNEGSFESVPDNTVDTSAVHNPPPIYQNSTQLNSEAVSDLS